MEEEKLDPETSRIKAISKSLQELIKHDGWDIARARLTDRILELQNAFNIEDKSPEEMFIELRANKKASIILFDWLKDIEGTVDQTQTNLPNKKELYIINIDER